MNFYEKTLSNTSIPYVIFGHLGDNHLHINLLPQPSQKELAASLYEEIARKIISWNGTVAAEHGIGKIKKKYFHEMVGKKSIEELKAIKNILDPQMRLGREIFFNSSLFLYS